MKKTGSYLKCGIALLILLILISSFVFAQSELVIKEEREDESALQNKSELTPIEPPSDEGGVVYTPPYIPAPQEVIDSVNNYIISRLGEDYFDEHFKLIDARKLGSRYIPQNQTIEPTYSLNYNYTHDLKDEEGDNPYQMGHIFRLKVHLNGELMADIKDPGPREPYKFLISKSEARDIGMQNGMKEPQVELYYGGQGYNSDRPIERGNYLWGVWEDCAPEGNVEGLFIHVDTGEILGKRISGGCRTEVAAKDIELGYQDKEEQISEPIPLIEFKHETFFQKITNWIKLLFQ